MKTIKLREFQRYLHRIIKEGESLWVVNQNSELLFTVLMGDGHISLSQKEGEGIVKKEIVTVTDQVSDGRVWESQIIEEQIKCDKCRLNEAEYRGENYDETGEWVTMKICEMCYKKFKPRNFKKI